MTELWQMSGLALGSAIASGEVSAIEVLDAILARVEAVNPQVNAAVTPVVEPAHEEARAVDARIAAGEMGGPFCGVPVSIKDMIETKGVRTTFGWCCGRILCRSRMPSWSNDSERPDVLCSPKPIPLIMR